jgi:hypothetical protein
MDKKLIANEIDELQRAVQDLKRDEDIDISLGKLVTAFGKSKEVKLTDDIWDNLENTESNDIVKGDLDAVKSIAKRYGKTDPEILVKAIKSGQYHKPMIVKFDGGRYHLVAGNTRLCTAKAMGVTPKVFIADVSTKKEDVGKNSESTESHYDEQTMAGSSGQYSAPLFSTIKKELREEILSTGEYDVPAFGKTSKGSRKNPLKIDGPDSIYKGRAVKDKDFPKWGGPDSVFIKIKEKCKKFPYCNQGDINALKIFENESVKNVIEKVSNTYNLHEDHIKDIILYELRKTGK